MRHLQLYERFNVKQVPWDEIDKIAQNMLTKDTRFSEVWDLAEKHPEFNFEEIHDKYLVPLANHGRVVKNVPMPHKIVMVLSMILDSVNKEDAAKNMDISGLKYKGFEEWYNNGKIRMFRGVPSKMEYESGGKWVPKFVAPDLDQSMKSFTVIGVDYAKKFTNSSWVAGTFMPKEKDQNGYVLETEIAPKDIHIFSDAESEMEIIPSKATCKILYKVKAGRLIKP